MNMSIDISIENKIDELNSCQKGNDNRNLFISIKLIDRNWASGASLAPIYSRIYFSGIYPHAM